MPQHTTSERKKNKRTNPATIARKAVTTPVPKAKKIKKKK